MDLPLHLGPNQQLHPLSARVPQRRLPILLGPDSGRALLAHPNRPPRLGRAGLGRALLDSQQHLRLQRARLAELLPSDSLSRLRLHRPLERLHRSALRLPVIRTRLLRRSGQLRLHQQQEHSGRAHSVRLPLRHHNRSPRRLSDHPLSRTPIRTVLQHLPLQLSDSQQHRHSGRPRRLELQRPVLPHRLLVPLDRLQLPLPLARPAHSARLGQTRQQRLPHSDLRPLSDKPPLPLPLVRLRR